ncbi:hypothetical protein T4B_556 [Trichinella pseudospiralis]|uniref:Uncharacterized protein n=1 Tax=Trichinella pseudospiralis TaxID=6337 RepID=A0A0V1GPH2_TRIPS|nr:hypothetical protein T4B_556 [Trichinella pseudospiralis]
MDFCMSSMPFCGWKHPSTSITNVYAFSQSRDNSSSTTEHAICDVQYVLPQQASSTLHVLGIG